MISIIGLVNRVIIYFILQAKILLKVKALTICDWPKDNKSKPGLPWVK